MQKPGMSKRENVSDTQKVCFRNNVAHPIVHPQRATPTFGSCGFRAEHAAKLK
jgi:hypothetical protein